MTETIISAETCGGNTDDAYASCLGKLATPGATEVTFTQEETGAFYNHEGRRLSSSKLMRGIEAEMSGGHFNASARTILAIDGGTCVGGAEYLAVAGRLGLPLTIMVRGGVDMGAAHDAPVPPSLRLLPSTQPFFRLALTIELTIRRGLWHTVVYR